MNLDILIAIRLQKMGSPSSFQSCRCMKLKLRVFLRSYGVAMVTSCVFLSSWGKDPKLFNDDLFNDDLRVCTIPLSKQEIKKFRLY